MILTAGCQIKSGARSLTAKMWMIMRLTIALLLFFTFHVNAHGYAQKITIIEKNVHLVKVFESIENQTGLLFFYDKVLLKKTSPVTLNISGATLEDVLSACLKDAGLTYSIVKNTIVIQPKKTSPTPAYNVSMAIPDPPPVEIHGKVVNRKGEPLKNISVVISGSKTGTATDSEGRFTLSAGNDKNVVLEISSVGFKTKTISVGAQTEITITLEEEVSGLNEVVIVGYGTQKKENLTGAVGVVNTAVFTDRPTPSAATSLQGTVAGLDVTQLSGTPGSGANLKIREVASWKGTSNPLFVIDGILRDQTAFDALNPADIENISILKDAASASIYGMMAGNGVVLVTTKRGSAKKTQISYNASYTTNRATTLPKLMNAYESAVYTNKFYSAMGNDPQNDPSFISPDELDYFKSHSYNALDELWKNPWNTSHNLSLSGGSEKISYYLSGSYLKQQGAFSSSFDKYTVLGKLDGQISKGLDFHFEFNGTWNDRSQPVWAYTAGDTYQGQMWFNAISALPYYPLVINGKYQSSAATQTNFAAVLSGANGSEKPVNSLINPIFSLRYEIPGVKGLAVKSLVSFSNNNSYYKFFGYAPSNLYIFKKTGTNKHIMTDEIDSSLGTNGVMRDAAQIAGMGGNTEQLKENWSKSTSYQLNEMITYNRSFGLHNVDILGAYEQIGSSGQYANITINGYPNLNDQEIDGGQGASDVNKRFVNGSKNNLNAQLSYFGRLDYNYDMRYLLGVTYRADASYLFAPGHQWGYFPSVSAGWNISKEAFFKPFNNYISLLKLRGSIGLTGSNNTDPWQWQQNYIYNSSSGILFGNNIQSGISLGGTVNPMITWERNRNINAGIDASLRNGLLNFTVDYWHKNTYDILDTKIASLPSMVGATLPAVNYGKAAARGFEITIGHQGHIGNVKYQVGANWSVSKNWYQLKDQSYNVRDYQNVLGYPISGVMYGLVADGIIRTQAQADKIATDHGSDFTIYGNKPKPGMLMFKDIRGALGTDTPDGRIDDNDQQRLSVNGVPRITYGINLDGEWKGWNLHLLFSGKAHYDVFLDSWARRSWNSIDNLSMWNDVWTPSTPNASLPSPAYNSWAAGQNYEVPSTFWLRSGSYIRLKTAQLGYSVPTHLLKGLQISSARFYFTGENLFLISKLPKGFDPELGGNYTSFPILKSFTAGLQVTF